MKLIRALALCLPLLLRGQNLPEFEKKVHEFNLPNGMHFIVLERHEAPVVSFFAYVDAGAVDDFSHQTGLAHMFEHMIGKGTATVGTKNWPEEKKALQNIEVVYDRLDAERNKGLRADAAKVKQLEAELKAAIDKANSYVVPNEFVRVIESEGAAGFNAGTGNDATMYFYSLPANRSELWFMLQSEWFRRPVFREFYKERDVVREERRMRTESNPQGRIFEALMTSAFAAHPYRQLVGWASDIENLRAKNAEVFHKTYYVPGNITIAIAGDITAAEARRLADKYYASIPAGPAPPPVITVEPKQDGEKRVWIESQSQPFLLVAYKRPDQLDKDDPVFDVVESILSSGRTGLLYKDMVRDKKLALAAFAAATVPSGKYPNLFLLMSVPGMGKTVEENEKELYAVVDRLKNEKVDEATLSRVKTKVRAGLIRQLDSNSGLAQQLASYYVNYGDWRKLFTGLEEINRVTADDVQRVARKYFVETERTVAYTVAPKKGDAK